MEPMVGIMRLFFVFQALEELTPWMLWITRVWTWLYIGTQDVWAVVIIVIFFSKYGNMRLGKQDEKPEFRSYTFTQSDEYIGKNLQRKSVTLFISFDVGTSFYCSWKWTINLYLKKFVITSEDTICSWCFFHWRFYSFSVLIWFSVMPPTSLCYLRRVSESACFTSGLQRQYSTTSLVNLATDSGTGNELIWIMDLIKRN